MPVVEIQNILNRTVSHAIIFLITASWQLQGTVSEL